MWTLHSTLGWKWPSSVTNRQLNMRMEAALETHFHTEVDLLEADGECQVEHDLPALICLRRSARWTHSSVTPLPAVPWAFVPFSRHGFLSRRRWALLVIFEVKGLSRWNSFRFLPTLTLFLLLRHGQQFCLFIVLKAKLIFSEALQCRERLEFLWIRVANEGLWTTHLLSNVLVLFWSAK